MEGLWVWLAGQYNLDAPQALNRVLDAFPIMSEENRHVRGGHPPCRARCALTRRHLCSLSGGVDVRVCVRVHVCLSTWVWVRAGAGCRR
jgi:hypothetical protein